MVSLTEVCGAIIQKILLLKLKDLDSFMISCTIGTHFLGIDSEVPIVLARPFLVTPILTLVDKDREKDLEMIVILDSSKESRSKKLGFLKKLISLGVLKCSIEEPPNLELKSLYNHLLYANLERLLKVLREQKKAIGWTIAYTKRISPSFYVNKIFLEDEHKASIENQRRLNSIMKELVKKETIKWLDAGIIYLISYNSWINPIQHVRPKIGGLL
ncbi:hypothetical protein CDL12_21831 [Handroanthus impetiginosus]|uniref:DNA-directed DNA polymerase n=1 Tax=Handroanthus impetiginosus TaxID=429701 RepID=A0A2G9GJZ6_9LAMI|nr:hypothetical protein CDL12_21831 [Handroanthus impetiginosus]